MLQLINRTGLQPKRTVCSCSCRKSCVQVYAFRETPAQRNSGQSSELESVLKQAEADLSNYCESLEGEAKTKCNVSKDYFSKKWRQFEKGCTIDKSKTSCDEFERWEKLTRELVSGGHLTNMCTVLYSLEQAEEKTGGTASMTDDELPVTPDPNFLKWEKIFQSVDKNGNGVIDPWEVQGAMQILGDELTDRDLERIGMVLDNHGHVTKEEFMNIALASQVFSHKGDAKVLLNIHPPEAPWWSVDH